MTMGINKPHRSLMDRPTRIREPSRRLWWAVAILYVGLAIGLVTYANMHAFQS